MWDLLSSGPSSPPPAPPPAHHFLSGSMHVETSSFEEFYRSLSFDEAAVVLVVLFPVLCVLQILAVRLRDGCCDSTYVEDDGTGWSGELNEAPSDTYTEEQRRRDRAEEARIKGRAGRSMSMSHV